MRWGDGVLHKNGLKVVRESEVPWESRVVLQHIPACLCLRRPPPRKPSAEQSLSHYLPGVVCVQ